MSSNKYEQKQSQKIKKENQYSSNEQIETKENDQKTGLCANCNTDLPEAAIFCPECGSSTGHLCSKCGAPASLTADICQSCGTWLLEGQCKFCYAEIPDEALFCPECGKPKDGIPCPNCGKLSIFDFCSSCGKPVTEEAIAEISNAQDEIQNQISVTPEIEAEEKNFKSNQEARRWYNASAIAQAAVIEAELARLEVLVNSEPEPNGIEDEVLLSPPPPVKKSFFSEKQLESIRKTGAVVEKITKQRIEAERIAEERKRKEEERQRQIKEAQARKEELERQLRARRWRCYAYGAMHNSPNECAAPSMGGQWV